MFNDISYAFEKILYDRRLEEKLKKLQEDIDNQSNRSMLYFGSRGLQMHCAVICFRKNSSEAEILVTKRSESRNILSDLWEFGGAKITTKQSIVEQVKAEYKKDFGIEIEPVLDYSRKNPQPIPLAVYEIKNETQVLKETLVHKGIIILAKITEDSNIDLLPQKHESYQWVKKANYQDMLTEDQCVENFFVTLEVAFEKIEALNL